MTVLRLTPEEVRKHQERVRKRPKYGNEKTVAHGVTFASKREAARYEQLRLMRSAGEISNLRLQRHIPCDVNGTHVCTYIADFAYTKAGDSHETFEDAKGHRTALYLLKKKLVFACYGIVVEEV